MQPMNDGAFTRGELMAARMLIATRRARDAMNAFALAWGQATVNIHEQREADRRLRAVRIQLAVRAVECHERMRHASGG